MSEPEAIQSDVIRVDEVLDGGPSGCGELLMLLHSRLRHLPASHVIEVITYDLGAKEDLPAWCRLTGHSLLAVHDQHYFIRKRNEP